MKVPNLGTYTVKHGTGILLLTYKKSKEAGHSGHEGAGGSPFQHTITREIRQEARRLGRDSGVDEVEVYAQVRGVQPWIVDMVTMF